MAEKFKSRFPPDDPGVMEVRRAIQDAQKLADLRRSRGVTQVTLAANFGTSQENVSRIERQEDLYVSTLAEYVAALGGRLDLVAVFPDGDEAVIDAKTQRQSRRRKGELIEA